MKTPVPSALVLGGLLGLFAPRNAIATHWYIPADGPIPTVIGLASAGETITITDDSSPFSGFVLNKNLTIEADVNVFPLISGSTEAQTGKIRGLTLQGDSGHLLPLVINVGGGAAPVIENCTINMDASRAGSVGVYDASGSCTLKNCTVDLCEYAVYPQVGGGGTITFQDCKVYTKNIGFTDGGKIVGTRTTFVSAYTMGSGNSIGFDAVQHQKLIQCIVKGFYTVFNAGCPDDTVKYNIFSGYNSMNCGSIDTTDNLVGVDPLFCEAHESPVKKYSLRIDSPAVAANNAWNKAVGTNDGVECAWGTLARSTTVASNTTFRVLSDVVVPNGKSLTINSGSTVDFDNDDDGASGSDAAKNELIVSGSLTVSGSGGSPVVFESGAVSPADGDWYGISARYATGLSIDYADISKAVYGVVMRGTSGGTNTVSHSTFVHNTNYDIEVFGDSSPAPSITNNTITPGVGSGIVFTSTIGAATVSDNTITANGSTVDGIYLSGGSPTCTNNTISGATNGNCFTIAGGSPTLTKNKPKDSKYGIYVSGGTPNIGSASDTTSDNIVTGNSSAGAYFTGSSTGGVVRQSRFTGNAKGIVTKGNANPDLGNSGQDGKNIFDGNTTYCVQNQSTSGTVSARGNYLNGQNPPTCHNGSFDLTGYLTTLPASVDRNRVGLVNLDGEPLSALGVTPNPITGAAGIRFVVRRDVGRTGIQIYDVAGRLIKKFPESIYPAGEQIVTWDGRSGDGQATANGLYFVRISPEKASAQMIKILVSR